ncbi:unnamed protein product [Rotaria sp. Silwood1]|nr:unnamed protein product [Rotaria sp. Silwood1]
MKFELLPNEILFDLFDYLNGVDLLNAFYGLNYHFNFLLYKQYRSYRFIFNWISKYNFDIICSQHLPFIVDRIIGLSLCDGENTPGQINLLLSYIPSFSQFTQLRSLSIFHLHSYNTLMKIVDECHHLNHLIYLNFYFCSYAYHYNPSHFQTVVNMIWNLPKLTHCNDDISIQRWNFLSIPSNISTSLKYLNLYNNQLKWNQINKLFEHTPHLKYLSLIISSDTNDNYIPSSSLPTLIDLKISIYSTLDTSRIISFLQNTPNLRRFDITLGSILINGHQWEQIICNYLPKLKVFQLKMKHRFVVNHNIQEQVNELVNSFRSSFWIDEHKWFIRCITSDNTIHLDSLSKLPNGYEYKQLDSWQSTYPQDNQQEYYNNMNRICSDSFFDPPIPSNISLPNIQNLYINLPINNQFWSIVPSLKRLYSLTVSSYTDSFYSQLQFLLDQALHLQRLTIRQDASLPFQLSLFKLTNITIHKLHLDYYYHFFNEEKCVTLSHSLLGTKCQVLYIRVENLENIIILIKNMINLRALYVKFTDEKTSAYWFVSKNNDKFFDTTTINKDEAIQWLKDHLPAKCFIERELDLEDSIQIWIK